MKSIRNFILLTAAIAAMSIVSVNAQNFAGTQQSGKTIDQQVRSKILKLPYYEVFDNIGYSVNGSTVTLTGKVRNAVNRNDAEASVKRIAGVTTVVNQIEILPLSGFDESIRRDLYRTISNAGSLSRYLWTVNPDVRLIVDHGNVTLEGTVASIGDSNMMNIVANTVYGVFAVHNNLVITTKL